MTILAVSTSLATAQQAKKPAVIKLGMITKFPVGFYFTLKIVAKLETDCDQTKGFSAAQTIFTANADLKAMYSACGPPALGMDQAAKAAHFSPDSILLVGYDAQPEEVAAIKAGDEDASVAQFPSRIGSLGIATTWKVVTKQKVAKNVDTGTALVTKANAGQFG